MLKCQAVKGFSKLCVCKIYFFLPFFLLKILRTVNNKKAPPTSDSKSYTEEFRCERVCTKYSSNIANMTINNDVKRKAFSSDIFTEICKNERTAKKAKIAYSKK